jgi:hypothetical protein
MQARTSQVLAAQASRCLVVVVKRERGHVQSVSCAALRLCACVALVSQSAGKCESGQTRTSTYGTGHDEDHKWPGIVKCLAGMQVR